MLYIVIGPRIGARALVAHRLCARTRYVLLNSLQEAISFADRVVKLKLTMASSRSYLLQLSLREVESHKPAVVGPLWMQASSISQQRLRVDVPRRLEGLLRVGVGSELIDQLLDDS